MPSRTATVAGRRRGPSKGDLKEAAILDTAWDLLSHKPLGEITIDQLAAGAGISRSTFYFYFDSKEAVLGALASRVGAEVRKAAAPFFADEVKWTTAEVRAGVAGYLDRWKTLGHVLRAASALEAVDPGMRRFWLDLTDGLVGSIAAGVERSRASGTLPPGPKADELIHVLFGMLWRAGWEVSLQHPTRNEERRLIDTLTVVIVRSITGDDDPPAPESNRGDHRRRT